MFPCGAESCRRQGRRTSAFISTLDACKLPFIIDKGTKHRFIRVLCSILEKTRMVCVCKTEVPSNSSLAWLLRLSAARHGVCPYPLEPTHQWQVR